jgi:hypothetical protein
MLQYEEVVVDRQTVGGLEVQVWSNPITDTWTLIVDDMAGMACVLAAGSGLKGRTILGSFFRAI